MNTNSINKFLEKSIGLKKSQKIVDYTRDSGTGNIAYRLNRVERWKQGDFHVVKYYQNTYDFYFDNVDARSKSADVINALESLGCTNIIDHSDRGFIKFDIPKENIMNSKNQTVVRQGPNLKTLDETPAEHIMKNLDAYKGYTRYDMEQLVLNPSGYTLYDGDNRNVVYKKDGAEDITLLFRNGELKDAKITSSRKSIKSSQAKLHSDNMEDVRERLENTVTQSSVETLYDGEDCFITVTQKNHETGNNSEWSFVVDFGTNKVQMLEPTEDEEGFTSDNEVYGIIKNFLNGGMSREKRMNRPDYDSGEPIKITGKGNKIGNSRQSSMPRYNDEGKIWSDSLDEYVWEKVKYKDGDTYHWDDVNLLYWNDNGDESDYLMITTEEGLPRNCTPIKSSRVDLNGVYFPINKDGVIKVAQLLGLEVNFPVSTPIEIFSPSRPSFDGPCAKVYITKKGYELSGSRIRQDDWEGSSYAELKEDLIEWMKINNLYSITSSRKLIKSSGMYDYYASRYPNAYEKIDRWLDSIQGKVTRSQFRNFLKTELNLKDAVIDDFCDMYEDAEIFSSRKPIKSSKSVCIGFNTDNGILLWKRDDLYTLDGSSIRQTKQKDIADKWIEKYNLNTTDTERLDKYTQEGIGQIPWGLPLVEDKDGRNYNKELSEILPKHGIKSGYIIEVTETDNGNAFAPTYVNGNSWQSENPQIFETREDAEEMADDFRKYLNKKVHYMHGRYQYKIKVIESSRESIKSEFNPYYEKHPDTFVAYLVGDKDSITQEDIDKAKREWYKLFYEGYGTLYGDQGHLFIGPYSSIKAYVEDYLGLELMDEYLHTYDYDHSVLDDFIVEPKYPLPTEKDYQDFVNQLNAFVAENYETSPKYGPLYVFNMYTDNTLKNNDGRGNEYPTIIIYDAEGNLDMHSDDSITEYIRQELEAKGWYPECVHSSSDFTIGVE